MTSESAFIAALRTLATHPAARGLEDDCAVLDLGSETLILTHDAMAAGIHFLPSQDAADVAWKLVATNLSDLAAKGAEPIGLLLGYQLGTDDARFVEGLREALAHYQVALLGGDTIGATGRQVLGLTAVGRATHRPVPSRAGAKQGDAVWVTGTLGAAMLGFEALESGHGDSSAYLRPSALLAEGRALAPVVSAMMDVSDGLLLDAWRMATASRVSFDLDSAAIPVADPQRRDACLRWGDDYQLLFTAPPETTVPVPASRIGRVRNQDGAALVLDGRALTPDDGIGYQHSRS